MVNKDIPNKSLVIKYIIILITKTVLYDVNIRVHLIVHHNAEVVTFNDG